MMLRLKSGDVGQLILCTWVLCFLKFLCPSSRVIWFSDGVFNFRFIHERMFWEELDDYPEVIRLFFSYVKAVSSDCLRFSVFGFVFRSGGWFECDIIFVGKRERVSQIEVTFFEFVFGKIMFWISLSLVGVLFDCYDNVGYHYDAFVCIFSTY